MNKKKKRGRMWLIWGLLFVLLLIILYGIPSLGSTLRSTYTVKYGSLSIADEGTGYFVRDERVYHATGGGTENRYISEGTLVRKGVNVMEIDGSNSDDPDRKYNDVLERLDGRGVYSRLITQDEGVVSYTVDGFEYQLTPETMEKKTRRWYEHLSNDDVMKLKRSTVHKKEPVFKVADRSKWYIVMFIDAENIKRYRKGEQLRVRLDDRKTIYGEVHSIKNLDDGYARLIIEADYYYDHFASERTAQVKVTMSEQSGLKIPNGSISRKNGVLGVYVQQKTGKYKFTPIQVLASDGETSIIAQSVFVDKNGKYVNTVQNYDQILRHGR